MKRKRQAVWRECLWCKARGIAPAYKSGKLKILQKHMVLCQAAHGLEQQNLADTRPKIDLVMAMVQLQQKQIADLTARVAVMENRKRKPVDLTNYWFRLTPKQCWAQRKRNAVRMMQAALKMYDPTVYTQVKCKWDFFLWYFPFEVDAATILQSALWPCLEKRDEKTCLRGIETEDPYCIFKNIWGKSQCRGADFGWYIEALQEVGAQMDRYNAIHISNLGEHFEGGILRFQNTKKKVNGTGAPQGLVRLVRIWQKTVVDEDLRAECISLQPRTPSSSETPALPDPCLEVSAEARADNRSVSGHQSNSDTHQDYVSVRSV